MLCRSITHPARLNGGVFEFGRPVHWAEYTVFYFGLFCFIGSQITETDKPGCQVSIRAKRVWGGRLYLRLFFRDQGAGQTAGSRRDFFCVIVSGINLALASDLFAAFGRFARTGDGHDPRQGARPTDMVSYCVLRTAYCVLRTAY